MKISNFNHYLCRPVPSRHAKFSAVLLLLASAVLPCGAATNIVRMANFSYSPKILTNNVGDTVLWTNTVSTSHNVVSSNSAWAPSALFPTPGTFSVKFTQPGVYGYYCTPHRSFGMTGIIYVQAVANQPPVVSLTNPPAGLTLAAPATVSLGADASDPDGSVASVQFFSGTSLAGASTTSPYSLTLPGLAAGTYDFTARAEDNLGASSTSAPVTIKVVEPAPISFAPGAQLSGTDLIVRLGVTPELRYSVDRSENMGAWISITNFMATDPVMGLALPTSGDRSFFRGRLLPNP